MSWEQVDEGWGRRAVDFAYLAEIQMWPEYLEIWEACAVSEGIRVLDIACGAGLALRIAHDRGAEVARLDASTRLAKVATARP